MKMKTTWKMCEEEQFIIPDNVRRELLRHLLEEEDAYWGEIRSHEAMEGQLDYLMGECESPYYSKEEDFKPLSIDK